MTGKQKQQITDYRKQGYGYTQISKMMDLSIECVRTYCKRHGLGGVVGYGEQTKEATSCCEQCGTVISQYPGRKHKRFCSDRCRMLWWNSHQDQVKRKANYECSCANCKKVFISYGNKGRKYCSHFCYIEHRFGGEES